MNRAILAIVLALLVAGAIWGPVPADACLFCTAQEATLSERIAVADAVALAEWVKAMPGEENSPGWTAYRVIKLLKGNPLLVDSQVTVPQFHNGKPGGRFLVSAQVPEPGAPLEWGLPLEITKAAYRYLQEAPAPNVPAKKRLPYFAGFLEHGDPVIANDAFAEFALANDDDIAAMADELPREKLRQWVTSPKTLQTRVGVYGMLLGLCGDESDARRLEARILEPVTGDVRLGIDGIMGGYLLLTGDRGLDLIDRTKLQNHDIDRSEVYSALQALRYMWSYGHGRIKPERLRQSLRALLDRPDFADYIIKDLSRWKDWGVQERLIGMYGVGDYDYPAMKTAILGYLFASSRDEGDTHEDKARSDRAREVLREIQQRDPQYAKEVRRFFVDVAP
ncbi:MAG TPA: hypothetical protein VHB77_01485 [Planctomycetaceae bacterium]|nr:hypothetical protein [Planctomycetaceae bacterium]